MGTLTLRLLAPTDRSADWEQPAEHAAAVLIAHQTLWHPAWLADADLPPILTSFDNCPEETDAVRVAVKESFESQPNLIREGLQSQPGKLLLVPAATRGMTAPRDLTASLGLASDHPELLDDFFALGFAKLGLTVIYEKMGQSSAIDDWSLMSDVRPAAEAYLRGDVEQTKSYLQAAFDQLNMARQNLYPATINLIDLGLYYPQLAGAAVRDRIQIGQPTNLLASTSQLAAMFAGQDDLTAVMRDALDHGRFGLLSGVSDGLPLALLPLESRLWRLARSDHFLHETLGRQADCFASHVNALTPDLPQWLMKFGHRYALHAAFDGSRLPHFREPSIHWTSPDGSVIETLARPGIDANQHGRGFLFLHRLAETLQKDRYATLSMIHWFDQQADWLTWVHKAHAYAPIFGKFVTISDYFMNSGSPFGATKTRSEEYATATVDAIGAGPNPISRWIDHHQQRGRLDAALSLDALAQLTTGEHRPAPAPLEDDLETEQPGSADRLREYETAAVAALAQGLLQGAPTQPGWLLVNPCSFPRRVCSLVPGPIAGSVEAPVKTLQLIGQSTAVVADLPSWGYLWLPRGAANPVGKTTPMANGRKLINEFIEVEIDGKTGGIRGVWPTRSGYSRIGQQLAHPLGSKMVCKKRTITSTGPAFGEIVTEGDLIGNDGRTIRCRWVQTIRLWSMKPVVELTIDLAPAVEMTGKVEENALSCRWAWPDEKTIVSSANGFTLSPHRSELIEAPTLIELRERNLVTHLLTKGLPFHHRVGYRMADTILMAAGETRRRFEMAIGMDLAHPLRGAVESLWPVAVVPVEHGPPTRGRSAALANLGAANVIASRLTTFNDYGPGWRLRLLEAEGQAVRLDVKFDQPADRGRLVNAKHELIYDLHPTAGAIPIDFSPHEALQVEVIFASATNLPPSEPAD